jgi:hypothetical protein
MLRCYFIHFNITRTDLHDWLSAIKHLIIPLDSSLLIHKGLLLLLILKLDLKVISTQVFITNVPLCSSESVDLTIVVRIVI